MGHSNTFVQHWPPPKLPTNEIQLWALDAAERGIQTERRRSVMPLYCFPDDHLERIRWDVEQDWKPDYWFRVIGAQLPTRSWPEWHWQRGIDPDKVRKPLDPNVRRFVIERDGYVCGICTGPVDPADVHIDHIYPHILGGSDHPDNLRVTHSLCNLRKGAKVDVVGTPR